jgi:IPT/TIG domain
LKDFNWTHSEGKKSGSLLLQKIKYRKRRREMQTKNLKEMARTIRQLVVIGAVFTGTLFAASPSITGLSPTAGYPGTAVTITGANFGSNPGTVTFNGTQATVASWSATSIKTGVPQAPAGKGVVVVTVGGVTSNAVSFTVLRRAK